MNIKDIPHFILSIVATIVILIILVACKPFSKNTLKNKKFETN